MKVRHNFDVAHYSLDEGAIAQVEQSFGKAAQVCKTVIGAYVRHLGTLNAEAKTMEGKFIYFGYGSNMLTSRLRAPNRAPSGVAHGRGHVVGRKLTFHKVSEDGSGKGDMQPTGDLNDRVEGVLFWIDETDRSGLEEAEGKGRGYAEAIVDVVTENGTKQALAYVATNVNTALVPYIWYRSLVLAGAIEHGLPAAYVDGIRAVAAQVDPMPNRRTKREAEGALEGTGLPSE
jgi:cation transport regulator ChaC